MPWIAYLAGVVRANGGVSIDSSEDLLPVRIGFWQYPIQFGLILPLTVIGAGVALSFLRRPSGPARDDEPDRWAPRPLEGPTLLVTWWLVPFSLAALYQPSWPLEDAFRPQRMWMLASQPGPLLAAMGLVALAEVLRRSWPARTRLVAAAVAVTILVATVPTTVATERLLWTVGTEPRYAHLRLGPDRVPDFTDLLAVAGPRPTILTYEDWSSLVWYETGAAVVAVEPPGFAKLAFDPAVFTVAGQEQRRLDLANAFTGDASALAEVADDYDADRIVLGRRGDAVGRISRVAALAAAEPGATSGPTQTLSGNGWDAVVLEPGSRLSFPLMSENEPIQLEIRVLARFGEDAGTAGPRRIRVLAGDRPVAELAAPPAEANDFQVLTTTATLAPGEPLVIEAVDRIAIQSVTGYVPDSGPPPGWSTITATDDAVVWGRTP